MEASTGMGMLRRDAMRYIGLFAMTVLALMTAAVNGNQADNSTGDNGAVYVYGL